MNASGYSYDRIAGAGMRRTGEVRQSSLSTDKGGAANRCARGGCGADGGAHSAGTEECGGHCFERCGGLAVEQGVGWVQWESERKRGQHQSAPRIWKLRALHQPDVIRPFASVKTPTYRISDGNIYSIRWISKTTETHHGHNLLLTRSNQSCPHVP